ncbi:ABC transporter ATP-binding protein [Cytobacillus purgationiresistens]|uniref:Branched-chain amino acid transport system ATP-binding protein n=1 Tax=Cytobacillus purgationiresistens TaxID=863449 RepID=A0ABU0ABY6_9BACI|nr:ABC transporter ATP-binding protein [Cytobacillus purgationiresistens]MDQ0268560.1 branched-chain amino acid transport system ATP-binding protein [Cytobacillus purgationiresistens]
MTSIIETKNLGISFGNHKAVDQVNFAIDEHQFTSIIGPNGAGKTTLFNLLSGQLKATNGDIFFCGKNITKCSTVERTRLGMGRSFQLTNVFPNLTTLENVRLAVQAQKKIYFQMLKSVFSYKDHSEIAKTILKTTLLVNKDDVLAKNLSHGDKRKLELAMLLALDTKLLLLDEPTAGMSVEDVPAIYEVIERIKEEKTKTILLIEHKMDMIMNLSDRIMVLFNGKLLADGAPKEIIANETVQSAYLGGLYDEYTA